MGHVFFECALSFRFTTLGIKAKEGTIVHYLPMDRGHIVRLTRLVLVPNEILLAQQKSSNGEIIL